MCMHAQLSNTYEFEVSLARQQVMEYELSETDSTQKGGQ